MASDTEAVQKQRVLIFRRKVCGMTGRNGRGKSLLSLEKAGLSAQTAIARRHAPGMRLQAPCRRARRCRKQFRLPGSPW
jgi:ribosomal protein L13E